MSDQNKSQNIPYIPTEFSGNIAPNIHNAESTDMKGFVNRNANEVQQHYREGAVTPSDFKPTQNVWKGNEKDLDTVLVSGDLGKDTFFTSAFDRQEKGVNLGEEIGPLGEKLLHGNKGTNLGNLESEELMDTFVTKQHEMTQNFKNSKLKASDFKPTQNVIKGHESDLDQVLVTGDLEINEKRCLAKELLEKEKRRLAEESSKIHQGNKGTVIKNFESQEIKQQLQGNEYKMEKKVVESNVEVSNLKPTQNAEIGKQSKLGKEETFARAFENQAKIDDRSQGQTTKRLPTNEEAFKGQSLEEIFPDRKNETSNP